MHLIESYALSSGSKIGTPYIYEKLFPLPLEKYITLHPDSSCGAKNYDYWQEVVDFLFPVLLREGFSIIQIGKKEDKAINKCVRINGLTNINQVAYVIRTASLHLGADSFPAHIASAYKKKIVGLYSNNFKENVRPYWGDSKDHVLFQDLGEKNPSFSSEESPKTINNIKPEDIANSVLQLLGFNDRIKFRTISRGSEYLRRRIESIPNEVVNETSLGVSSLIVRMDLLFNEEVLIQQLFRSDCIIVTNKPINIKIIKSFKKKIKQIIYILDENHNPDFVREIQASGLEYHLESRMSDEELNAIKLYYLDFKLINRKLKTDLKIINDIKNLGVKDMLYRSNWFIASKGNIYPSQAAWEADLSIQDFNETFRPLIDSESFWKDLENFYLLKPID